MVSQEVDRFVIFRKQANRKLAKMLMDLEPQDENPWLSQVEIWNKKMEIEKELEKEKEEARRKVVVEAEEVLVLKEEEEVLRKVGSKSEDDADADDETASLKYAPKKTSHAFADLVTLPPSFAPSISSLQHQSPPIHFQYFNINNNNNLPASLSDYGHYTADLDQKDATTTQRPAHHNQQQSLLLSIPSILYSSFLLAALSSLLLLTYHFTTSLHLDVSGRVEQQFHQSNSMVEACALEWRVNGCEDVARGIPHMKAVCGEWEECMRRDPNFELDRYLFITASAW